MDGILGVAPGEIQTNSDKPPGKKNDKFKNELPQKFYEKPRKQLKKEGIRE